ncbi:hypothetical protein DL239_15130 [Sedimentitalea sp. CY04]|uniref:Helix-turn-helix domain-containing protein n=2 Tax=Parasedimentitalea denitrificans TaxID=2211118 RepID=A0ABX0WCB2_9RHOB|nr:hypothetical protein [Sedimentitalea sp. CY04]
MPGYTEKTPLFPGLFDALELEEEKKLSASSGQRKRKKNAKRKATTNTSAAKENQFPRTAKTQFLTDHEVAKRYGVCRQTIWRWAAKGELPNPKKVSARSTRWRIIDLVAYEASLPVSDKSGAEHATLGRTSKKEVQS